MSELPVYPRWRGELPGDNVYGHAPPGLSPLARELIVHINNRGEFNGLSPLARGTHYGPGKKRAGGRFIPAGAGNSGRLALQPAPAAVYPRWRGELATAQKFQTRSKRFIPAGAGNSQHYQLQPTGSPVYPRWRGELSVFGITFGFGCGLSPLARGTLRERIAARLRKRFIPAGAGNSLKVYICS
ncbi:Domain of uncharacterised function (DUF2825) [Escherichia coli]|nr:Domain of uncharacterised function (DUF2825) [Escherichia coli]